MAQESEPAATASTLPDIMASVLQSIDAIAKNILTRLQTPEPMKGTEVKAEEPQEEDPQPPLPLKPPFEVSHLRNECFIERHDELGKLFAMWKPMKKGRMAVVGLGGIGKSELAIEFVYRLREISADIPIYWFGPDELVNGARLDEFINSDHTVSSLLIVDASKQLADSPLIRRVEKLQDFCGTIIFLARSFQTGCLLADPREIYELHKLEEEASVVLLRQSLCRESLGSAREEQLREVVQAVACLPRAIIQVASLMNNTRMQVHQFLEMYEKDDGLQLRLYGRPESFLKIKEDDSVISRGVFDLKSFRSNYVDATGVLFQIYFLGGASVPISLFSSIDELDLTILMSILKGHFLVFERDETYNIHPLVYLAIRASVESKRPAEDDHDINREKVWHRKILHNFSRKYPGPVCEERDWWRSTLALITSGWNPKNDPVGSSIASIHLKESKYFRRKGLLLEALKSSSKAKSCLPDQLPKDNLDVIEHHVSLLKLMGKYKDAHEVLKECPEGLEPSVLVQKKGIEASLKLVDADNGFALATQELKDIREQKRGNKFSATDFWRTENDYAIALMLKGDYKEAEARCRGTLRSQRAKFGASHEDIFSTAHILAEILLRDGRFENAAEQIEDAVRGREALFGSKHPDTVRSKVLKAEVLLSTSCTMVDFEEAEAELSECASHLSKAFSDTHPFVLSCKTSRAQALMAQGKYEASQKLCLGVLSARENGPWESPLTHPDTLMSKHQLAEILRVKEGPARADELSKIVFDERTARLTKGTLTGNDFHPDQLSSLQHRAIILSLLGGRSDEAHSKIKLALDSRKTILRPDHPDVFSNLTWHGEILRARLSKSAPSSLKNSELDTIEGLHKQAIEGSVTLFGPEHQNTLQCMTNLAFAKNERATSAGYKDAMILYDQIYRTNLKNLGLLHPETLKSKIRLARAMRMLDAGLAEEARKLWREACDGFAKIFGTDGYGTIIAHKEYEEFFVKTHPTP